ncbi:Protein of unknown function [Ectopseudomonas composti]|uniref:DUF2846 domain-containing protein n=1 Tax=Ectopseudomonas composti TaxID=658457 RepID=A0A1I5LWX3_9GAMM|nr:DUF2846 domain-containing protein [Pseudomonas composti]SFP01829.1 Protein of unknown function [Pseudomonas composti]
MRRLLSLLPIVLLAACSTPGAFFGATQGDAFTPHVLSDENHALVYLYRPRNDWADQELEAPGLFLDNRLIGSLPSNGYLVLEFDAANYKLEMRRPLVGSFWTLLADGPLDFTLIASFTLDAAVGATYYLRYDEDGPPPTGGALEGGGDGPLQLVSAELAQAELTATRQVQPMARIETSHTEPERPQRGFWRSIGESLDKVGI